jgi:Predicted membrane protein
MSRQAKATRFIVYNGVLAAAAVVLIFLEIPLIPGLKIDASDIPAAAAGVLMGPFSAVAVEFIKVLIHLLVKGFADSMGYGDLMNFIVGVAFTVPFSIVFRKLAKREMNRLLAITLAGLAGMAVMVAAGVVGNYFIAPPFFKFYMHTTFSSPVLWGFIGSATILNVVKSVLISVLMAPITAVIKRRRIAV